MKDGDPVFLNILFHCHLTDVEVFHVLANRIFAPLHTGLVVVVQGCGVTVVREGEVAAFVAEGHGALRAFIGGQNLGLGAAAAALILAEGLPGHRAPHPHDNEAAHGAVFPKGNIRAIRDAVVDLGAPASIGVSGK